MQNEEPERNLLGDFQRALDLIHRINAPRLLRMNHIHRRRSAASHFKVGKHRRMHRKRLNRVRLEPVGDFADMRTAGVIKVLARSKKLNTLRPGLGENIEKTGMQTAAQKYVCRNDLQHR